MQRLFSTFPDSWPGGGLLILRIAAAMATIVSTFSAPLQDLSGTVFQVIASATGALLLIGLWTPVAGLLQVCVALTSGYGYNALSLSTFLLSTLGLALSMTGPGAWSVDARLFGRKQIDFRVRKESQ
jgi:putative oxidoreductase